MIYSTKHLLKLGETAYSIRKKVQEGSLFVVERGIYSDKKDDAFNNEMLITAKYPSAVLTGLSAFYLYDLTDHIPDYYYIATEQHSYPISRDGIKQSYQDPTFFKLGITYKSVDCGVVRTYNLERLLIELIRLKEKYPPEVYYEVLNSFRKNKNSLDFYLINKYSRAFSNGDALLLKIKELL